MTPRSDRGQARDLRLSAEGHGIAVTMRATHGRPSERLSLPDLAAADGEDDDVFFIEFPCRAHSGA